MYFMWLLLSGALVFGALITLILRFTAGPARVWLLAGIAVLLVSALAVPLFAMLAMLAMFLSSNSFFVIFWGAPFLMAGCAGMAVRSWLIAGRSGVATPLLAGLMGLPLLALIVSAAVFAP